LLKELDKTESYHVTEQRVTTVDQEFKGKHQPTTYSQTRQKYKQDGGIKTDTYIIDSAKALPGK
jgi:hypothetical protein